MRILDSKIKGALFFVLGFIDLYIIFLMFLNLYVLVDFVGMFFAPLIFIFMLILAFF